MPVMRFVDRLAGLEDLDPVAQRLSALAQRFPATVRDALHGVWLGHPLHPALAQVPVGAWTAAWVLDLTALATRDARDRHGIERAARVLVATGLVTAPTAALPGFVDWSRLRPEQQRVGLVHAWGNVLAAGCMAASLASRAVGRERRGRAWAFVGVSLAGGSAALGGHLAYRYAAGANHAEGVPHTAPGDWSQIGRLDDFPEGLPRSGTAGETRVVAVRRGGRLLVLAAECSHLSGPLADGTVTVVDGRQCLVCPWHGSTFDVESGEVVHGPATSPQPVFEVRIVDGVVEVRPRPAAVTV